MSAAARLAGAALALAALAGAAAACGLCDQDKVAATYDHALLVRASARGHVVAFVRVRALGDVPPARIAAALRATFTRLAGVDPGSVRVSADPLAAAFACDPRRAPPARLVAAAAPAMARAGAAISLLEVMTSPQGATAAPMAARVTSAR